MAMDNENSSVGTDSFLDVITNFVGILIILVMVVGERASRMPLPEVKPPAAEDLSEKQKEAAAIEANVQEIAENMQRVEGELNARTFERDQVSTLVTAIEHELGERRAALNDAERSQYDAQSELALAEDELKRLEQERQDAEATSAPQTITVESYPTPLGKTVSGKEAHFQLSGGKLTFVPFDALLDRLRATVSDYARQMNNAPEIRDTIGPVGGFRMRYVVERHDTPNGSFLQLSYVELLPVSGQLGEPVDQALAPHSRFREKLEMMSPREYTITVWTYPDSFAEFRRLKKELYEQGFQVAGRPLPEGMPIGASPRGTALVGAVAELYCLVLCRWWRLLCYACSREREHGTRHAARRAEARAMLHRKKFVHAAPLPGAVAFLVLHLLTLATALQGKQRCTGRLTRLLPALSP